MRFHRDLFRAALSMTLMGALAACGESDDGITGPSEPTEQFVTVYDLTVTVGDIQISKGEACDGRTIFGAADPGEFHYRIEAGVGGAIDYLQQSKGYGEVTGRPYSRAPGTFIGLTGQVYRYTDLPRGDVFNLRLRGTEWDGLSRDNLLKDVDSTHNVSMNQSPTGTHSKTITIGSEKCGMTLEYEYTKTVRRVKVG